MKYLPLMKFWQTYSQNHFKEQFLKDLDELLWDGIT